MNIFKKCFYKFCPGIFYSTNKGFSIAEFIVTLGLFLVLTSSLAEVLVVGVKYYRESNAGTDIQQSLRTAVGYMTDELRQAAPNDDPGLFGNQPSGYKSITPPILPNGVIIPNVNQPSANLLEFTKPDFDYYAPGSEAWNPMDPRNYKRIKYYIKHGNTLYRSVTLYESSGKTLASIEDPIIEIPDGTLEIICSLQQTSDLQHIYRIRLIGKQDKKMFTLTSNCAIPANPH